MHTPDLLSICIAAFIGVIFLLGALAAIMRLILIVFPVREKILDAVLMAAISATVGNSYPNMKITNIEEMK